MHWGRGAWTRLSALINSSAVSLKQSLAETPKSFPCNDLIEPSGQDEMRSYASAGSANTCNGMRADWR